MAIADQGITVAWTGAGGQAGSNGESSPPVQQTLCLSANKGPIFDRRIRLEISRTRPYDFRRSLSVPSNGRSKQFDTRIDGCPFGG